MKNKVASIILLLLCIVLLASCSSGNDKTASNSYATKNAVTTVRPTTAPAVKQTVSTTTAKATSTATPAATTKKTSSYSSFTNKYGTPTTICAHRGCTNYIASSGDTNCCIVHSRKCAQCGKYIDEDATYCMDCIKGAAERVTTSSGKKCVKCSNPATKILMVTQPSGESETFNMCQAHYDEYKRYFNSKKGWSAW